MDSFNSFVKEEKPGLYANIHAKRARIKAGSGEKMRKPGSEGAPTTQDWKDAAKTAKEEVELDEVSAGLAKKVAQARDNSAVDYDMTPTQSRRLKMGDKGGDPDMNAAKALKSAMKRGAKNIYSKEEYSLDEAVSVKKQNYSWGKMVTVHHGSETSYPLHPEHQAKIKALGDGEKTSFKDETKRTVTAHRDGDTIHLSGAGTSKKTPVARSHFAEEVSPMIKAPKNEFATKADAFAHAKEKGGKVMKKTFTHPTTGQQHVSYVVKEAKEKDDLPFTPDKPSKTPIAKAGKYGVGYSTVKHLARMALKRQQEKKKMAKEEVELGEGKYGSFRVRQTSGTFGGPKLPRRPYVHQGDTDPRTGLPLGFSNPPKSEKPEDKKIKKEEVEQMDELKKSTLASYAKKAVKNVAGRERWQGDEEGRYDGYDEDEHKKEDEKLAKRKKNIDRAVDRLAKEEAELDEALRHKVAGAVAQFIGNKIDPVHGEIMRVHGEEAYRQAAYHIRKTLHGLHKALKNHLESGKLQTEEVNQVDEVLDSPGKAMGYLTKATISGLLDKGKFRKRQAGIKNAVNKTRAKINSEEVEVSEVKVKMPKPTKAYKEYTRLTGKTPEQRGREEDERQKEMERQRQEYIKQGIIKA